MSPELSGLFGTALGNGEHETIGTFVRQAVAWPGVVKGLPYKTTVLGGWGERVKTKRSLVFHVFKCLKTFANNFTARWGGAPKKQGEKKRIFDETSGKRAPYAAMGEKKRGRETP